MDKMISCKDGIEVKVDDRLLDFNFWNNEPKKVIELLKNIPVENKELFIIAKEFLSIMEGKRIGLKVSPEKNQFIVVLGNVLKEDGSMRKTLLDRLEATFCLHKINPLAKILASGNGETLGIKESDAMKDWLVKKGVPENLILKEGSSRDTVENIIFSTNILKEEETTKITIVTSEDHMMRSYGLISTYFKMKNIDIKINSLESEKSKDIKDFVMNENKEKFILFKDIGRVLGLWEYENYNIPKEQLKTKII